MGDFSNRTETGPEKLAMLKSKGELPEVIEGRAWETLTAAEQYGVNLLFEKLCAEELESSKPEPAPEAEPAAPQVHYEPEAETDDESDDE